jgi:hypothetical protein
MACIILQGFLITNEEKKYELNGFAEGWQKARTSQALGESEEKKPNPE